MGEVLHRLWCYAPVPLIPLVLITTHPLSGSPLSWASLAQVVSGWLLVE